MKKLIICCLALTLLSGALFAQPAELTKKEINSVIDSTCQLLQYNYIHEDIGSKITKMLQQNKENGTYDEILSHKEFAQQIEADILPIINDKHFHFRYDPAAIAETEETGEDATLNDLLNDKRINFGVREAKIMNGNVGYFKLDRFPYPSDAKEAITGALSMLSNSDALIIDLSDNRGGYNESVQLLMSAFFEYPIHINTIHEKSTNQTEQFWTYPYLHGPLMDSIPVYILTSSRTFSAGEWFAFTMQQNKRATIVGEISKGGATPSEFFPINENFMVMIPNKECICAASGTHFNNVGVQPDIKCSNDKALNTAYAHALQTLDSTACNETIKKENQWIIDGLTAEINPVSIDQRELIEYEGKYGRNIVSINEEELFITLPRGTTHKLTPINSLYFKVESIEFFRIQFIMQDKKITGFNGRYSNGYEVFVEKTLE
jgi:hypothetical protein